MSETAVLLSRPQTLAQARSKLDLLCQLRDRIEQRLDHAMALAEKGGQTTMAVLDRNAEKLRTFADKSIRSQHQINRLAKRFQKVERQVPDMDNTGIDRQLARVLQILDKTETLLEVELLELDGIVEEIEGSARRN
jgi:hypothetical protein